MALLHVASVNTTQLSVLPRGHTTELQVGAGYWGPSVRTSPPGGWSFLTEWYWQPTNQPSAPGVGNKIHPFPEARVRKLDGQSPAAFCPSSPDPDSRGGHSDSISLRKENHGILEIRFQASTVTYWSYRSSVHAFILKKLL